MPVIGRPDSEDEPQKVADLASQSDGVTGPVVDRNPEKVNAPSTAEYATVDPPESTGTTPDLPDGGHRASPPFLPVVDIEDLDWHAISQLMIGTGIRGRIADTVSKLEAFLSASEKTMLFDTHRAFPDDKVIHVIEPGQSPLWFIGDLHGDLLALESALSLILTHPKYGSPDSRIIFLGDLFDDEGFGLEVVLRVFELILAHGATICVIAGNHDESLGHDGNRFTSNVSPSDFSEFLNNNLSDDAIVSAGKLAIRLFANAPRALFFPDGLLVAHGGFPLADLHCTLKETGDWNAPSCLSDFVWARAHPTARKKLPNRFTRGSQFGHEDFSAFCSVAAFLGRPVTHMVRGHDHVEERYQLYAAYKANPVLTTVALSRRLSREFLGSHERLPTVALYTEHSLPQVFRLHIPPHLIRGVYPDLSEPQACDAS
ncbi:metallophosphoesterase [Bradyrhizobium sp. AUGA SZCCT0240]|uniref:metallophosphoesterase n=1 Tax=unclassified Bradyrhizobium TaxID=2631580 RepID=UPI001BA7CD3B|nr:MULTISPECIES: metallophosphoesterase [unclassified Bradyrhizobium]MBR1193809.1 metallophosphoesterase [Bradyrhizobium sp. AUGA SZCCT0160]MBR1200007.1 metallophosphoesterase [Bradyrhizobium sp. AUGA SZCCT0158]MBR1244319.1 metallophosphoesterase [Bradyrhizobium sp. AUGA SZCCT0274]MBR1258056.1 metallophosphoesterase [Bradyrhizobium sp. AUGA SZCCT0240]